MRRAKSGDAAFIQRIEKSSFNGIVHSIFNKTINLKCLNDGELYTIASTKIDNGPNTLLIDINSFREVDLALNDKVYGAKKVLSITNKLAITVERAEKWESNLPDYPECSERLSANLVKMKHYIHSQGKAGGMKPDTASKNIFVKEMSRLLNERSRALVYEVSNNRGSNALQSAAGLIGLGPGLTPSGDDYLVGFISTLHLPNCPCHVFKELGEQIVKMAKPLTNEISYMALKKASIGSVRESLIHLLDSLVNGTENEMLQSLKNVLEIGSSSGTDIALGIVSGIETNLKVGGRTWL
ncbi:DUF2877 domain-containing protein [Bacillus sp. sid0103]|uniref:DUF2877 domain-containing protein n=1 Tax=Bacillus sp. sid0103 TaxID=2856337 RepID=UPI001C45CF59|nr:DUF2877 domain-containing protein [Bacillus sp. sid0103]MBV7505508.1 DUF2877 domain-containing protein [Bacillus sp. sid0103]